jgi:putative GTP pyrophosphokinase
MTEGSAVSKSQLDRLGSRLRNAESPSSEDLLLLNRYREQFIAVSDSVVALLRTLTSYSIESRHKSIPSIVAKLRRKQPARLSAIQDMAGARIIVFDATDQDELVHKIAARLPTSIIDDKRKEPVHGYRAVHVIASHPLVYEIQVRTTLEHAWAQLSERLADRHGFELKYGGGPPSVRDALLTFSDFLYALEKPIADSRAGLLNQPEAQNARALLARLPEILEALEHT